jgi:hypothetical protein
VGAKGIGANVVTPGPIESRFLILGRRGNAIKKYLITIIHKIWGDRNYRRYRQRGCFSLLQMMLGGSMTQRMKLVAG